MVDSTPFRKAMARHHGSSLVEELLRSSLWAAEAQYFPEAHPRLIVDSDDGVSARDARKIALALTNATALFAHHRISPHITRTIHDLDQSLVPELTRLVMTPHMMVFGLPPEARPANLSPETNAASSVRAALELCQTLPSTADDWLTVETLQSLPSSLRTAVGLVISVIAETNRSLGIEIQSSIGADRSLVTCEHALALLNSPLLDDPLAKETITSTGILDASRTSRRTFYLVSPDDPGDSDIYGTVVESALPCLPPLFGRKVTALISSSMYRTAEGQIQASYRLLSVAPEDEQ
ncbi:hypothetical protein ACQPW1_01865 [Nocardia sp. CA-128927]|uniref:hypothetical protein n=1 Tax=Nocardia sp. CA-128927 TaxID=3239975 RepID=UPI003D9792EA